jgi:hypothetical protein
MTNQEFRSKYAEGMGVDCNAPEAANFASWKF